MACNHAAAPGGGASPARRRQSGRSRGRRRVGRRGPRVRSATSRSPGSAALSRRHSWGRPKRPATVAACDKLSTRDPILSAGFVRRPLAYPWVRLPHFSGSVALYAKAHRSCCAIRNTARVLLRYRRHSRPRELVVISVPYGARRAERQRPPGPIRLFLKLGRYKPVTDSTSRLPHPSGGRILGFRPGPNGKCRLGAIHAERQA